MRRPTAWNPFTDITDMQSDLMNTVMEQMAHNVFRQRHGAHTRSMDVDLSEDEHAYHIHAVLPGINPENLTIDFAEGVLTIKAECKPREESEGLRYHLRECHYGPFERSFRFPALINAEDIEANYQHGILALSLPKAQTVRSHRVQVQTSS